MENRGVAVKELRKGTLKGTMKGKNEGASLW